MRNENTGLESIVTWQEALGLFTRLCAGRADISYGDRLIGSYRLPVLEARLDDPAHLLPPRRQANLHSWTECAVAMETLKGYPQERIDCQIRGLRLRRTQRSSRWQNYWS